MPRTYVPYEFQLLAGDYNVHSRVEIMAGGVWRELTNLSGTGRNYFDALRWSRAIDAPVMTGTLTLIRSILGWSLAPAMTASPANTIPGSYVPLLKSGNALRVSTAPTHVGLVPGTNAILQSATLGAAPWAGAASCSQTGVGLDGLANSACIVTDGSAVAFQERNQSFVINNDGATHTARFRIKKDAVTTRAPQPRLSLSGGTAVSRSVSLNTQTGAFVPANTVGGGTHDVMDGALIGDPGWWIVTISVLNNTSGNNVGSVTFYPAARTTYNGADDPTATGSATVGNVDVRVDSLGVIGGPVFTTTAPASEWREVFLGRIDDPDWGGDDGSVTCSVSDVGAWLMDKGIDVERTYAAPGGTAVQTVMQSILADNVSGPLGALLAGGAANPVTLYTPVSPGWNIKTYKQARVPVLEALRQLAQQIGHEVRFAYDAAGAFRLTFYKPPRTKVVADYAIAVAGYYELPELAEQFANVRTRIGGSYIDATTKVRLWRYVQSAAPLTDQYDVRYMEINEADSSNIDSATEMDLMLNAALSDLQYPPATHRLDMPYFWLAELHDLVSHTANAEHYDVAQLLAVSAIDHVLSRDGESTSLTTRGSVAGNNADWIAKQRDGAVDQPGPSLDVVATPGPTSYSIAYLAAAPPELSISGGAYALAPSSPIVVTRPAAGGTPLEYTFRLTINGQTVTDMVTVQPIDRDTVTPDLTVVPSSPTTSTQDFTVTGSNPSGGATPGLTFTPIDTNADHYHLGVYQATISSGTNWPLSSGDLVRVNRPAFGTVIQASVTFFATLAGGGAEKIQRSILNQVKTSFGPTLDVKATPGPTTYSIAWSGVGTLLSIDGAAYAAPGASPIAVTRPAAGSPAKEYTFQNTLDGQVVTNVVTVPSLDKDTVTPDLTVVPGTMTPTGMAFSATATNPSGGAAPSIFIRLRGTISTSDGLADGTEYPWAGASLTVDRPPFGTTTQASMTVRAALAGGGEEIIQRTILNQVKDSFGPSLVVTPTPSSGNYSLAYAGTYDTLLLSIDGGTYAAPAASPIVVTRTSVDHTYAFKALKDGQEIPVSVTVPAAAIGGGYTNRFTSVSMSGNDSTDQITVSWVWDGDPSATFRVFADITANPSDLKSSSASSPYSYASGYNLLPSGGAGNITFYARIEAMLGVTVIGIGNQSHVHAVNAF